jgi:hypothetical protein
MGAGKVAAGILDIAYFSGTLYVRIKKGTHKNG